MLSAGLCSTAGTVAAAALSCTGSQRSPGKASAEGQAHFFCLIWVAESSCPPCLAGLEQDGTFAKSPWATAEIPKFGHALSVTLTIDGCSRARAEHPAQPEESVRTLKLRQELGKWSQSSLRGWGSNRERGKAGFAAQSLLTSQGSFSSASDVQDGKLLP